MQARALVSTPRYSKNWKISRIRTAKLIKKKLKTVSQITRWSLRRATKKIKRSTTLTWVFKTAEKINRHRILFRRKSAQTMKIFWFAAQKWRIKTNPSSGGYHQPKVWNHARNLWGRYNHRCWVRGLRSRLVKLSRNNERWLTNKLWATTVRSGWLMSDSVHQSSLLFRYQCLGLCYRSISFCLHFHRRLKNS
jgi:hypothetical protein